MQFNEDKALRTLLEGTMGETGKPFFRALARGAAEVFGTAAALVTEFVPERRVLRAIGFYMNGVFIEDFEYAIADTPCELVVAHGQLAHFPDGLTDFFPIDSDLREQGVMSYLGVPLRDAGGGVLGHISLLHTAPLPAEPRVISIFELFAQRAAAELQRLHAERRVLTLTHETEMLRSAAHDLADGAGMVGRCGAMQALQQGIARVAPTDATVLILGETGTGKELVARALHVGSRRAKEPLVRVNCAAVPANLIESEFFGHERGAFTGAVTRREGRFAAADGGTIFLDEIGEMPLDLQAKLLRVLQEGEYEMLGSTKTWRADVRVIAATNRNLEARVREGGFREDLYYRLSVFPLRLPPLRERGRDIVLLAEVFAARFAEKMGYHPAPLAVSDHELLLAYHWPGNVRELQNVIERALILGGGRADLTAAMPVSALHRAAAGGASSSRASSAAPARILTAKELRELERENIVCALKECGGRIAGPQGAARRLGLPATTLASRMKALRIPRPE